ncbi:unnamed protein product, partial [Meganyctiphanes norvegica]
MDQLSDYSPISQKLKMSETSKVTEMEPNNFEMDQLLDYSGWRVNKKCDHGIQQGLLYSPLCASASNCNPVISTYLGLGGVMVSATHCTPSTHCSKGWRSLAGPLVQLKIIGRRRIEENNTTKTDILSERGLHKRGLYASIIIILSFIYGKLSMEYSMEPDKRQNTWILMTTPLTTLFLSMVFIFFVTVVGPWMMRGRPPVKGLKNIMIAYNAGQVILSTWIFYMSAKGGWLTTYSWSCQLCDYSNHPQAQMMLHAAYWYYFSKFIDFIDTIFFVAHKKYEHISLLHVVHHAIMPINCWFGLRYIPGGHSTLYGFLNSFVHMVMYTYYLLSALGPEFKKYLWWKKYLTKLQLTQFMIVILHSAQLAFIDCPIPAEVTRWVAGTAFIFLALFTDFYWNAYIGKKKQKLLQCVYRHNMHRTWQADESGDVVFAALSGYIYGNPSFGQFLINTGLSQNLRRNLDMMCKIR